MMPAMDGTGCTWHLYKNHASEVSTQIPLFIQESSEKSVPLCVCLWKIWYIIVMYVWHGNQKFRIWKFYSMKHSWTDLLKHKAKHEDSWILVLYIFILLTSPWYIHTRKAKTGQTEKEGVDERDDHQLPISTSAEPETEEKRRKRKGIQVSCKFGQPQAVSLLHDYTSKKETFKYYRIKA